MHYLTLDTCTWIYLANGTEPAKLLHYVKEEVESGNITILVPEVIIEEWNRNKTDHVEEKGRKYYQSITEAIDKINSLIGDKSTIAPVTFLSNGDAGEIAFDEIRKQIKGVRELVSKSTQANIRLIEGLLSHKNTVKIQASDRVFMKAGQFALKKKAPFFLKNSFADAIIFFSFLEYVNENSIEGAKFITYNTSDFCDPQDKRALHPDLKEEFDTSQSLFYTFFGEALNTIKNDIVTEKELAAIERLRWEIEGDITWCHLCSGSHNEVRFSRERPLIDRAVKQKETDPNQLSLAIDFSVKQEPMGFHAIQIGECNYCGGKHFICVKCGVVNGIWEGEVDRRIECEGCGQAYLIDTSNDWEGLGEDYKYIMLNDDQTCPECGNHFEDDGHSLLCSECTEQKSQG